MTLSHAHPLEKVHRLLALGKEEDVVASDGNAEDVMEVAEIRHGKLSKSTLGDAPKEQS